MRRTIQSSCILDMAPAIEFAIALDGGSVMCVSGQSGKIVSTMCGALSVSLEFNSGGDAIDAVFVCCRDYLQTITFLSKKNKKSSIWIDVVDNGGSKQLAIGDEKSEYRLKTLPGSDALPMQGAAIRLPTQPGLISDHAKFCHQSVNSSLNNVYLSFEDDKCTIMSTDGIVLCESTSQVSSSELSGRVVQIPKSYSKMLDLDGSHLCVDDKLTRIKVECEASGSKCTIVAPLPSCRVPKYGKILSEISTKIQIGAKDLAEAVSSVLPIASKLDASRALIKILDGKFVIFSDAGGLASKAEVKISDSSAAYKFDIDLHRLKHLLSFVDGIINIGWSPGLAYFHTQSTKIAIVTLSGK